MWNVSSATVRLKAMAKQYKLDVFKVLNNINQKNANFFRTLTDEEKKEIQPFVLMRWLTGSGDPYQVYLVNELINPFAFALGKHKELLFDLMTLCGNGRNQRYKFIKVKSRKGVKMPKVTDIIKEYFGYNTRNAIEAIPMISTEDIIYLAEELGRQKPEITVIKKELRTRPDNHAESNIIQM